MHSFFFWYKVHLTMTDHAARCILVVASDHRGASFVLFDVPRRTAYNDIIECDRVRELYARFGVRMTVTDDPELPRAPHGGHVVVNVAPMDDGVLHDRRCAVRLAGHVLRGVAVCLSSVTMQPFRLDGEEWTGWLDEAADLHSSVGIVDVVAA